MPISRRILSPLLLLGLLLSACASSPTTAPNPTTAVPTTELPEATATAPATAAGTPAPVSGPIVTFALDAAGTQARFLIDEILRGSPNTVTGATSQVTGGIEIDLGSPVRAVVGPIQVEAGSLATDSSLRDRAIRNFILQTSAFPQVVFTPISVEGLPEAAVVGEPLRFTVTGDLTIRDVSRPVIFSVTVNPESDSRLTGLASATILRSDFGLTIPSVPSVADVSQEVRLELEFVAVGAQ
jgi:polyisoprenoid-binding protein YceI